MLAAMEKTAQDMQTQQTAEREQHVEFVNARKNLAEAKTQLAKLKADTDGIKGQVDF